MPNRWRRARDLPEQLESSFELLTSGVMQRIAVIVVLLVTAVLGQSPSQAPPSANAIAQENVQKARALLDQTIQALGGQAYLGIQDRSEEGRTYSFFHGQSNSAGLQFWRFSKFPDKDRIELTKKRDVAYVYNGNNGYEITYKGTVAMDAADLNDYQRRRAFSLDWVLRKWLHEPGVALFYEGATVAEQKPAEQVTLMNSRNQGVTLYVDPNSHLPIKKMFSWRDPKDKQRNVEEEVYDSYRKIQGVVTPFSVTRYYNGDMANQRFLTTVTYNRGLSDSLFAAGTSYEPKQPPPKK